MSADTIRSDAESTEYETVVYRAVKPRRRDFWKVLTGRYTPEVIREVRLTLAGFNRLLKETWTAEKMEALNYSPLLDALQSREARSQPAASTNRREDA